MSRFTEDELLVSRAIASGWRATVEDFTIKDEGFWGAWRWIWEPPDQSGEPIEVFVSSTDTLIPALTEELRERFRRLEVTAPNEIDPVDALKALLITIEHDLKWLVDVSHSERVYDVFATAYAAVGSVVPEAIKTRLPSSN